MSNEDLNIEKLIELRHKIENKIQSLKQELEELNTFLQIIDRMIESQSYKPAIELAEKQPQMIEERPVKREVLFMWRGKPLAWVEIYLDKVIVDISTEANIPIDHKLVAYIKRELDKIFEEDLEKEAKGEIEPGKRFIYTMDEKDGLLTQIEFIDHGNEARRRDLLGKIRWVLRTYARENL